MPLIKWDPFNDLQDFLDDNNTLHIGWDCAVDIYEENNNVIVEMNVPGIDPDKFEITIEDDLLHVSGSRKKKEEIKDKEYYRKEIRCGSFERNIHLPKQVEAEKTSASYNDGVLKIAMPTKTAIPTKKVSVKVKT